MKSVQQDKGEKKPTAELDLSRLELGWVNPATMKARQQAARVLFGEMWERQQRLRQEAANAAD
ncbi:hypothetical protein [Deinococcus altitudinis]|uniref:hypothetical protein n=1 Tax=Deinococcus altitudinis TaxID=468914 RepID=UPI0038912019